MTFDVALHFFQNPACLARCPFTVSAVSVRGSFSSTTLPITPGCDAATTSTFPTMASQVETCLHFPNTGNILKNSYKLLATADTAVMATAQQVKVSRVSSQNS